ERPPPDRWRRPRNAMTPPLFRSRLDDPTAGHGRRNACRTGKADRQAQTTAGGQKGEGLGFDGVAAPALGLRRRDGEADTLANGGQQHGVVTTAAADDDLLRLLGAAGDAQHLSLSGKGGQGGGGGFQ